MTYLTESQPINVDRRIEGLRKAGEGSSGVDVTPVLVGGVVLLAIALITLFVQKKKIRDELAADRRAREIEAERRKRRLAEEALKQRHFRLTKAKKFKCAEPCPVTDLIRVRPGISGSLLPRDPGPAPVAVSLLEMVDGGLLLALPSEIGTTLPQEPVWLAIRQTGGPRLYPVEIAQAETPHHPNTVIATPMGPGWKFFRFGRQEASYDAIAMPMEGQGPPKDEGAVPIEVVSIGIGSLEFTGPVEAAGGTRLHLRVALPSEVDSIELPVRVRGQAPDGSGENVTEVVFDAVSRPMLDILARRLVSQLDRPPAGPDALTPTDDASSNGTHQEYNPLAV